MITIDTKPALMGHGDTFNAIPRIVVGGKSGMRTMEISVWILSCNLTLEDRNDG